MHAFSRPLCSGVSDLGSPADSSRPCERIVWVGKLLRHLATRALSSSMLWRAMARRARLVFSEGGPKRPGTTTGFVSNSTALARCSRSSESDGLARRVARRLGCYCRTVWLAMLSAVSTYWSLVRDREPRVPSDEAPYGFWSVVWIGVGIAWIFYSYWA